MIHSMSLMPNYSKAKLEPKHKYLAAFWGFVFSTL